MENRKYKSYSLTIKTGKKNHRETVMIWKIENGNKVNRVFTKERAREQWKKLFLMVRKKYEDKYQEGGHTIYLLEMVLKALLKKWTWWRKKQNISEFEDTQDREVELGSTEEFEINSNKSEE